MDTVEKEKDRFYTVWKLIATHGLFPQNLNAFGLISKLHREILRECCQTSCFWEKLRRNAMDYAENVFDDQEWINFETLRKSPIAQLPRTRFLVQSPPPLNAASTVDSSLARPLRPIRAEKSSSHITKICENDVTSGWDVVSSGELVPEGSIDRESRLFAGGGKRSSHRERGSPREGCQKQGQSDDTVCHEQLCTRRFLRLCFFPVYWMHEYKHVVLFLNVPKRFQESEVELHDRMSEMVLKYGRLNLQTCAFHSSLHDLVWSVEAGRKRRTHFRRYWIPGSPSKEPRNRLPRFKYQTVIAVCDSEDDVKMLLARKGRFRKAASIYVTRCASAADLERIMRQGNEHRLSEECLKEEGRLFIQKFHFHCVTLHKIDSAQ